MHSVIVGNRDYQCDTTVTFNRKWRLTELCNHWNSHDGGAKLKEMYILCNVHNIIIFIMCSAEIQSLRRMTLLPKVSENLQSNMALLQQFYA